MKRLAQVLFLGALIGSVGGALVTALVAEKNHHLVGFLQWASIDLVFAILYAPVGAAGLAVLWAFVSMLVNGGRARLHLSTGSLATATVICVVIHLAAVSVITVIQAGRWPVKGHEEWQKPERSHRIIILAIDGASWRVLGPLLEEGKTPNFAAVTSGGATADLETLRPTHSPNIWTTIATGKPVREHGIYGFRTFRLRGTGATICGLPGRLGLNRYVNFLREHGIFIEHLVSSDVRTSRAFWNILALHGLDVAIIGWWATWPAEEVNGVLLSDQLSPMRTAIYRNIFDLQGYESLWGTLYPPGRLREFVELVEDPGEVPAEDVASILGVSPGSPEIQKYYEIRQYSRADRMSVFKFEYVSDLSYWNIAEHLLQEREWDAFAVYLPGLDGIQHHFWKFSYPEDFAAVSEEEVERYGDVIGRYYVFLDGILGKILEHVDEETTLVILSDHGFESNSEYDPEQGRGYDRYASGVHRNAPPGVLILFGRGIRPGAVVGAHVYDVLPTILTLSGLPVAEEMPGRILEDALTPEILGAIPAPIASYDVGFQPGELPAVEAPDEEALDRLRAIGYFD